MPPLVCFKFGNTRDGIVVQKNIDHYEQRAKAGTGLIVVEATCVSADGKLAPTQLGIWSDEYIDGLSKIAKACHKHGSVVTIQIHHGGFNTHSDCGEKISSSPWKVRDKTSRMLSIKEIKKIQQDFVAAATRAQLAGFDGVQIHGCHSYLLNSFSSHLVNKRTDEYGGNAENRTRFACDIIKNIRKNCGKDFIIDIRMAGNDPTPEIGVENAQYYINAGVDMLSVSAGIGSMENVALPEDFPFEKIAWLGVNIKKHYPDITVAGVYGINTQEQAAQYAEYVDIVSVGRAMLADGDWSDSVLNDKPIALPCIRCKFCKWFRDHEKCPAKRG